MYLFITLIDFFTYRKILSLFYYFSLLAQNELADLLFSKMVVTQFSKKKTNILLVVIVIKIFSYIVYAVFLYESSIFLINFFV